MKFVNIFILASLFTLNLKLQATEHVIVNYDDDKNHRYKFAQPVYYMDYERNKCWLTYCQRHNQIEYLKHFEENYYIGHPRSIGRDHFIKFYLRAKNDMSIKDLRSYTHGPLSLSPDYILKKDSQLKIILSFGQKTTQDSVAGLFDISININQLYFTTTSNINVLEDQKIDQFTVHDILLQKALKRKITGITVNSLPEQLIKAIDNDKRARRDDLIAKCKLYDITFKKYMPKKYIRAEIKKKEGDSALNE